MSKPVNLGLRDDRHAVSLVKLPGQSRPVLGRAVPADPDSRLRILERWGIDARSPREQSPGTIREALPVRSQTILASQLPAAVRAALDGSAPPASASRTDHGPGAKGRLELRRAELTATPPARARHER